MAPIQSNDLQEIIRLLEQAGMRPMLCDCPVSFIDTGVCAGIPTEPGEHTRGEYILLPTELVGMHPVFVIPVKGQSMKDADLMDGDQLKVEVRDDVTDGDIVLASIDGECTVKNYFVDDTVCDEQYAEICEHYRKDKVYNEAIKKKISNVWKKEKETYTEEELAVMEEYGINRPFEKTLKSKKQELRIKKGKAAPKRSGGRKSSSWLGNFKGYMRIVSVPFGGMKKR